MLNLKILLILAAFINALTWVILIPVGQYPDEQSHFAQVQNIAEFGKSQLHSKNNTSYEIDLLEKTLHTNRDEGSNNAYTYHPQFNIAYSNSLNGLEEENFNDLPKIARTTLVKQEATENPPLYYYLGSVAYKLFYGGNIFERIYAVRAISVLLFIALVIVAYKIAKVIFKNEKILHITLPALLAFMPMLVFDSTGVLPDPLTNLFFCLIIYGSVSIIEGGFKTKSILSLIFVIILGFYTRQQFLISIPIIITAFFLRCLQVRNYKGIGFLALILLCFTLGLKFVNLFVPEIGASNYLSVLDKQFLLYLKTMLIHWFRETLPWYWGVYRWLSLTVPHIYYQIINRLILLALLGLIIRIFLMLKKKRIKKSDWYLIFFIFATFIYSFAFALGDYYFIERYGYSFGIQGRYFFPLISAHFALLLIGFWVLTKLIFKKYSKFAICILLFLMVLFNDLSLAHVAASYYSVETFSRFISEASQYKPSLLKGNIILYILILNITLQAVFGFNLTKKIFKNELS